MNRSLMLFVTQVLGGGLAIGVETAPDARMRSAGMAVRPVWAVLYVLIAIAGWRVWQRHRTGWPVKLC